MDLIFMNASREDIGVLQDYELDLAFGADENNFECRIQSQAHCCEAGFFLYAEGTEYGGVIDSITSDTAKKEVIYSGRTWQGILNSKIIEPDEGADYLIVSGDANEVLHSLVERLALSDMFDSATEDSGIEVSNYKMHRYVSGYDGIRKMLASVGGKLKFKFKDGRVVLSALPVHDYSRDEEFDADLVSFKAVRNYKSVNHLICLGAGELADRLVVHLYADTEGNISQTQTQTGMDEVSAIYEYNNIDNEEELISEGTAKFKEILSADEISIDFDSDDDKYDVGDIIGAYDPITHLFATASIEKKIVTIKDGRITISLSPDKAKGGISMEIGGASIGGGGGGTSVSVDDVVTETLLWENASPTNEFNQQTISIPLGEYDMYKILYAPSTAYSTREMSMDARVGNGCVLVGMWADSDTIFHRSVASSTTGVTFYAAYANKAQSNSCCIPLAVYGIKIVDVRGVGGGSPGGTNIEVPVSIENGGTGATTAEEARANLGFVDSTGWVDLGLGSAVSESTENMGKSPYPCAYRVENGNHVYIAFNCKFTYAGSGLRVNNTAIPADHRPSKQVYTYVPMGGKYIARVITTPAGWVSIEWVQNLLSTTATTSVTSNWIDGYVDYWI